MHYFSSRPAWINASHPQHTPAGALLGKMYYGPFLQSVLKREEYSGYPHNGGEHTLSLCLEPRDLDAFIEIVKERYGDTEATREFIAKINAGRRHYRH